MNGYRLTVEGHAVIATTFPCTGVRPSPDVAGAWLTIEDEAKILDFDTLMDTGDDFVPARHQLSSVNVEWGLKTHLGTFPLK